MSDTPLLLPDDIYNQSLLHHVHPADWINPTPATRYNLVVIGGGTAGLVTAAGAAGLGAKVALVEKHLMGGDCLNTGCVPSKALIRSSRAWAALQQASEFGVSLPEESNINFSAVMERLRRLRAHISEHDSAARFKNLGVDVFLGSARFSGPDTIDVDGTTLRFKKAVIAVGSRAAVPPIPGLKEAGFLTNETVFSLTENPGRLLVLGGGPIGCELAQAFARLGVAVTLAEMSPQILPKEDTDAAEILQKRMRNEGVDLRLGGQVTGVEKTGESKVVTLQRDNRSEFLTVDEILVAVGRTPNAQNLGLEKAGVQFDERKGIKVNDNLQTTNPNIYAAGDCCLPYQFTHAADASARIVIQNTLFLGGGKVSRLNVPWCTYTDPEIAHIGLSEKVAQNRGVEIDTYKRSFQDVDRAILDGEEEGFVKIHTAKGSGEILGATIVASHAGDMIGEIALAMAGKIGLKSIASVIHPYPTQAEAIKQIGDMYNRTRLKPWIKSTLAKWFEWRR